MRRILTITVVIITALLMASCYMMSTQPTGSISINLGGPAGRAISSTTKVRVYLYSYASSSSYSLYTFPDGKQYQEFQYGTGTKTFTDIPAGLWQVLVSIGSDGPSGTDSFQTTDYGHSGVVSLTGGGSASASVATSPTPVSTSTDLLGKSITGLIFNALGTQNIVASSTDMMWNGSFAPCQPAMPIMSEMSNSSQIAADGLQLNSLSYGYYDSGNGFVPTLFVNSNKGIVQYDSTNGFNTSFSQYLTDTSGNPISVFNSGSQAALSPTSGLPIAVAVFYQSVHGIGGVYLDTANTAPTASLGGAPGIDIELPASAGMSPVYNLSTSIDATNTIYAFYATQDGAFWTTSDILNSSLTPGDLQTDAHFFTATANGQSVPIQAVAVDMPSGASSGTLYIGTRMGAYSRPISEANGTVTFGGSWTPVDKTASDNIVDIVTDPQTGAVAFRSRYNVYTLDAMNNPTAVTAYPFYAGMPGSIQIMSFAGGFLYIGGTEGMVYVYGGVPPC